MTATTAAAISRKIGPALAAHGMRKAAYNGWTARQDGGVVDITLNYSDSDKDLAALDVIRETLGDAYTIEYTPVLGSYDHLPKAFHGCAVATVRKAAPKTPKAPATPAAADAEPTARVVLPEAFTNWFEGTGLVTGQDDTDPECKATRLAYEDGDHDEHGNVTVTANATVLRLLAEYAGNCMEANADGIDDDVEGAQDEYDAAETLAQRAHTALTQLKTAPAAPTTPAQKPSITVRVDWTEKVRGQMRGIMIFALSPEADEALTAQGKEPQFRIGRAANRKPGTRIRPVLARSVEDDFKARADDITTLARECAAWLGIDPAALDIHEDDETR
jgi:hypothetical protein